MTFSNTRIAATGSGMEVRLLLLVLDGEEDEVLVEVGGDDLSAAGKGGNGGKGTDDCGELLDEDLDR